MTGWTHIGLLVQSQSIDICDPMAFMVENVLRFHQRGLYLKLQSAQDVSPPALLSLDWVRVSCSIERFHSSSSFRMKKACDTRWVKHLATRVSVVTLTCIRYQRCEAAGKAITKLPGHFIGKVNKPGALVKSNRFPSVPLNLCLANSNCCSDFLIGRFGIQGFFSSPSKG